MKKEELEINQIYKINYICGSDPRRSYTGDAKLKKNDGVELLFDLVNAPFEKDVCFHLEDVVGYSGEGFVSFDPDKITRIVVVGEGGREFEKWFNECEVSLQDSNRTIKFFTK